MDIDEFLDKEIQAPEKEDIEKDDVSSGTKEETIENETASKLKKVELTEKPVSSQPSKEEGSIKHYFDLWNKIY